MQFLHACRSYCQSAPCSLTPTLTIHWCLKLHTSTRPIAPSMRRPQGNGQESMPWVDDHYICNNARRELLVLQVSARSQPCVIVEFSWLPPFRISTVISLLSYWGCSDLRPLHARCYDTLSTAVWAFVIAILPSQGEQGHVCCDSSPLMNMSWYTAQSNTIELCVFAHSTAHPWQLLQFNVLVTT